MYHDSVGNTYTSLPAKKANKGSKGAKPGPKHGRKGHRGANCAKYRTRKGGLGSKRKPVTPNIRGKLGNVKPPSLIGETLTGYLVYGCEVPSALKSRDTTIRKAISNS